MRGSGPHRVWAPIVPARTFVGSFVADIKEHGPPTVPFAAIAGSGPPVRAVFRAFRVIPAYSSAMTVAQPG